MRSKEVDLAIQYFKGKYLEEGDNLSVTCDFLDSLETLLNYISELEDDNNELRKYYASRKEVEKLKDIIDALHETGENFISKDKIRDKIKELEEERKQIESSPYDKWDLYRVIGKIEVLNELLGE